MIFVLLRGLRRALLEYKLFVRSGYQEDGRLLVHLLLFLGFLLFFTVVRRYHTGLTLRCLFRAIRGFRVLALVHQGVEQVSLNVLYLSDSGLGVGMYQIEHGYQAGTSNVPEDRLG
jgi:hypothetical protein